MSVRNSAADRGPRSPTGHRIGEWHGRAKHPDWLVRAVRKLHKPGVRGSGYLAIANRLGLAESTVRDYLTYRTRWSA